MGIISGSSAHFQIRKTMLFWMKNGNKTQKKSETDRDGLVMMLGGHCFQGPTCISKYGHICISRSKTGIIERKSNKIRRAGQYCRVMHLGSRGRCPKREILLLSDQKVKKKNIKMIISVRVQPMCH